MPFCALTVMVVLIVPPSVMLPCAGLKLQVAPIGKPEQANDTLPFAPFIEAIDTVTGDEVLPRATPIELADVLILKSGPSP